MNLRLGPEKPKRDLTPIDHFRSSIVVQASGTERDRRFWNPFWQAWKKEWENDEVLDLLFEG